MIYHQAVPLSWWISLLITMKGDELIHLSDKTWWEEFRDTNYLGIRLVSCPSTTLINNLQDNAEICNNCMESCYIIVGGI